MLCDYHKFAWHFAVRMNMCVRVCVCLYVGWSTMNRFVCNGIQCLFTRNLPANKRWQWQMNELSRAPSFSIHFHTTFHGWFGSKRRLPHCIRFKSLHRIFVQLSMNSTVMNSLALSLSRILSLTKNEVSKLVHENLVKIAHFVSISFLVAFGRERHGKC